MWGATYISYPFQKTLLVQPMFKNYVGKHPLQNRTNVQIKGGGVKGLLNNVQKTALFWKDGFPNLQQMRTWKKGQRGAHSKDKVLGWKKETRLWSDWQNALSECICNSGGGELTALNGRDYTDDSLDHSRERPGTRRLRQNGRQPLRSFFEREKLS